MIYLLIYIQNNLSENITNRSVLTLLTIFGLKLPSNQKNDEMYDVDVDNEMNIKEKNSMHSKSSSMLIKSFLTDGRNDHINNRSEFQILLEQNQLSTAKIPMFYEMHDEFNEKSRQNFARLLDSWDLFRKFSAESECLSKVIYIFIYLKISLKIYLTSK